jgi:hypothetical protein
VDPEVHARFLDYLELREYFARPDLPKLDAKTFATLHAELEHLIGRERAGDLDAEGADRLVALRRVLLRD